VSRNRKIINKIIKSKPDHFARDIEGIIKMIPNILDFDNKRSYFKKEMNKIREGSRAE
jgi:hypothetical protein